MEEKEKKKKHTSKCEHNDKNCHCHEHNEDEHCHEEECHCHSEHCECEKRESKEEEYLKIAQMLQAEFDNYRKRSYVEIEKARQNGVVDTVKVLLPAVDSVKKAKTMYTDEAMLKGLDMILDSIHQSFKALDIEPIEAIGKNLDPSLHNAIAVVSNSDKEDGVIIEEYQTGYKLKDKVIRYSQVIVNKKGE